MILPVEKEIPHTVYGIKNTDSNLKPIRKNTEENGKCTNIKIVRTQLARIGEHYFDILTLLVNHNLIIESIIFIIRKSTVITKGWLYRRNNSLIGALGDRLFCWLCRILNPIILPGKSRYDYLQFPSPRHFIASTVIGCNVGKMRARLPSIDSISASG